MARHRRRRGRATRRLPLRALSDPYPLRRVVEPALRGFTRFHRWIYLTSGGWIGHRLTGRVRSLILHTTGRRTGQRRSVVLAYGRDGDAYLVMGSNFGRARPPGWLVNLQADPHAEVNIGHRRLPVTADIAMPGSPEYERLRPLARQATMGFFDRYEGTVKRPIPLVRLVPRSS